MYSGQYYHGVFSAPDCYNCPLRYDIKVLPDGPIPARLVFCGEEPGGQELIQGKGFVGPSGRLLWDFAKLAGIDRSQVWVTNSALCRARKVTLTNGAVLPIMHVKAMAAAACRKRLIHEMLHVTHGVEHPVIMPLGNWALWSLTDIPKAKIFAYRGSRIDRDLAELYQRICEGTTAAPIRQLQRAQQ
jgi:uracil-DNA glycosylase